MAIDWKAALAQGVWQAGNLPSWGRFSHVLQNPREIQQKKLSEYIRRNAGTKFGKLHRFDAIQTYEDFVRQVPLCDYSHLEPWIERISAGEENVLCCDRVHRLVPTSGTRSGRKLIPYTEKLLEEFQAGIAPWLFDLHLGEPGLWGGRAYWLLTPMLGKEEGKTGTLPVGFGDDTEYLSALGKWLAGAVVARPAGMDSIATWENFRRIWWLGMLRHEELRLISIWHPSLLLLLLEGLEGEWDSLIKELRFGGGLPFHRPMPARASTLEKTGPGRPDQFWPRLRIISCWNDAGAAPGAAALQDLFPKVGIQGKGLLATEGLVTIPFAGRHVLSVRSHFFEFIDPSGRVFRADELVDGGEYEVVLTTGGGLWRYRLGDRVSVRGYAGKTPCFRFIGRTGSSCDLTGEKLHESFVSELLQQLFINHPDKPSFMMLAPDEDQTRPGYVLFIESNSLPACLQAQLDKGLCQNPHYALSRGLGQLQPVKIIKIHGNGSEAYLARLGRQGVRAGQIKFSCLSAQAGWMATFSGEPPAGLPN